MTIAPDVTPTAAAPGSSATSTEVAAAASPSTPGGAALLRAIGTAAPPPLPQAPAALMAEALACSTDKERSFLHRVFSRSGVATRGCVLMRDPAADPAAPPDTDPYAALRAFYRPRHSTADAGPTTAARMALYARHAAPLAETAARRALVAADIVPARITHLITVSCTGFFAPGIDAALINGLGLSPAVRRTQIGFMGCHAAFNALGLAHAITRGDSTALVLVCSVELSSLHFAYGFDAGRLVANALFADGAAAAIVTAPPDSSAPNSAIPSGAGWSLRATASRLLPDTAAAMTWNIGDHGFVMTLAPDLPAIVQSQVRPFVDDLLARHGLVLNDVARFAVHPGGPKILAAVATALELPEAALRCSYDVLRMRGNMSSATILFILQQMAREPHVRGGPCLALGIGPGLMLEALLLD